MYVPGIILFIGSLLKPTSFAGEGNEQWRKDEVTGRRLVRLLALVHMTRVA